VRWRARTIVQLHRALQASRPQLKRDPLGSAASRYPMYEFSRRALLELLFGCAILTACAAKVAWRLNPSPIMSPGSHVPAVHMPDTMNAGSADTVVAWTGGGGCTRMAPARITQDDLHVTIQLFDSVLVRQPDDYVCPAVRWDHRNTIAVRFSRPGVALVRVIGSDTIDHTVVVR